MPGTITSDQLLLSVADAAYGAPWLSVGSFTTAPSAIDDYRIEGTNCYRGRLSASVRGWSLCGMPGASKVWQLDAAPTPTYVDITTPFNDATATDTSPFPTDEAVGDQMQIGWLAPFGGLEVVPSTLGTVGVVAWKYWNGTAWVALANVSDGTNSFKASGTQTVSWNVPTDWVRASINGSAKLFWIAAEVTTVYTINPVFSQGLLMFAPSDLGYCCFHWFNCAAPPSADTWANGGLRLAASSDLTPTLTGTWPSSGPTNSRQYYVNGSDGLRQSGYLPYVYNPSVAGSLNLGSLVPTRIRRLGVGMGSVAAMATGNFNFFWDVIRVGTGLVVVDGTSGSPADFVSLYNTDHAIGTMYGVITRAVGIYFLTGKLYVGQSDQAALTFFKDTNQVIVYQNFPVSTNFYEIRVVGASGKLSTFQLGTFSGGLASGGCTIKGAARVNAADPSPTISVWTLTGSDAFAVVNLYGSFFSELYRATLNSASAVRYCTFQNFGDITAGGAVFDNCTFQDLATAAPISATYAVRIETTTATLTNCTFINCATAVWWNRDAETSGKLDGSSFISGGTGHAIELGSNTPTTISLNSVTFSGYGGTPGSNPTPNSGSTDAAVYNNSGKTITINVSGGTTPSVRNGADATTVVVATVTITFTGMKDDTEVRVYKTSDGSEVAGTENATDGSPNDRSFAWSAEPGLSVDYVIHSVSYETIRVNGYSLPSSAASLPIQQRVDRNYENL